VAPNSVDIWKGRTQDFAAIIEGTNDPDQSVTWTVSGNSSEDTLFKDNILYAALDETAEHFTVTATSTFDPGKSGSSKVNLVRPKVTGVTILETDAAIHRGGSMEFHATVEGPKGPDQDVVWSIAGNSSDGTKFDGNKLTVAGDEANKSWTITAASYFDGEHFGTTEVKLAYKITTQFSEQGQFKAKYQDRLSEYVPADGEVTVEVNPAQYYKLKNLQYKAGSKTVSINQTSGTFTMPASDITISAEFAGLVVGDRGPGGGWIFYVNPKSGSWKYLECAPTDSLSKVWSSSTTYVGVNDIFGSRDDNASKFSKGTFPAAAEAASYTSNGLKDWYLPSHTELKEIKSKLQTNNDFKASVRNAYYWSSSEELAIGQEKGKRAYAINLGASGDSPMAKTGSLSIRAVRQF
jgi:hypothetical protein